MLKIGILGLGNAGGQIAMLAKKTKGFPAVVVNSSERDIEAIKGYIECIVIGNHEGAGKDRSIAKRYVKEDARKLIADEVLSQLVNDNDYIFIVSSCGGGTGSGTAPIITDILSKYYNHNVENTKKGKVFVNVGILPAIGESVGAQRNTIEYLTEMLELGGSYMLFDNDRVKGTSAQVLETVNHAAVDTFALLRGDYSMPSPYQMLDETDSRKIITMPGMIFVDIIKQVYEEKIEAGGTIEDMLIKHINDVNCMVKPDRDKVPTRLGFVSNLSEDVQEYFNENLPKIRSIFGEPIEDFKHIAINEDDTEANMLGVIISGMSLPENRLKVVKHRIDSVEEALANKKKGSLLGSLKESVSKYDSTMSKPQENTSFDLDTITGKY